MNNVVGIFLITTIGIVIVFIVGSYFIADTKQNTVEQAMTETIRSSAYNNIDNRSRIYKDELFIKESDFEKTFLKTMTSRTEKQLATGNYKFEYLKSTIGAIKAIRVKMTDSNGVEYQATCVVDISES